VLGGKPLLRIKKLGRRARLDRTPGAAHAQPATLDSHVGGENARHQRSNG